jgi:hypothetical protein
MLLYYKKLKNKNFYRLNFRIFGWIFLILMILGPIQAKQKTVFDLIISGFIFFEFSEFKFEFSSFLFWFLIVQKQTQTRINIFFCL